MKCQVCWTYDGHHWACNFNNLYKESNELQEKNQQLSGALKKCITIIKKHPELDGRYAPEVDKAEQALKGGSD